MNKLDESRMNRTILERFAATAIQKVFRGHQVRLRDGGDFDDNRLLCLCAERRSALAKEKDQYQAAITLVKEVDGGMITSGMDFRQRYSVERRKKATIIQCAYRQYIPRGASAGGCTRQYLRRR